MNALLAALCLLLGIAVALSLPGGAAAILLCAAATVLAVAIIFRIKDQRTFLLQIFFGGLLARVVVGTLIYGFKLQEFFGGDAYTYDGIAHALLDTWKGHTQYKDLVVVWMDGGTGWGMIYMVAYIYYVVGRNMLAVQLFNAVVGAATAPVIYLCAHHIFQNTRVARGAAFFVAFYPSLVLWSSQGLKDGPIVFLLALAMLATLRLGERISLTQLALLAGTMACLLTFRFYIFFMVAAAAGGAFIIGMRRITGQSLARQVVVVVFIGLSLTYVGVLRTAGEKYEQYGNLQAVQTSRADLATSANSGFGREVDVSTSSGAISAIPLGMVYLLFAPFPWQLASLRQSITLPEMMVWWASFPLLCLGVWFTLRHRLRQALPIIIFTTMLTLAYSIFQGNVGTAYRQRSQLLVFYFIFVAVGYVLVKERQEDRQRARVEEKRAALTSAHTAEAARRYQAWKREREKEFEDLARTLSERMNS
ncbi:MAG TPA: glycosyltransferase family 39 protein [Pyrinomonadaceae bacterium]|nr:glycosyltransferase family 39 protein [Pyrinomonadaceae bacterium]